MIAKVERTCRWCGELIIGVISIQPIEGISKRGDLHRSLWHPKCWNLVSGYVAKQILLGRKK